MLKLYADLNDGFFAEIHEKDVNSDFVMEEHLHKYHEIYFLLEGATKYFINNEIIYIDTNQAAFVKSGYIHKTSYNESAYSKRMLICFTSEFIGEQYLGMINELGKKKVFSLEEKSDICNAFMKLYNEYTDEKPYCAEQCKNLLRELIINLSRLQMPDYSQILSANETLIQTAAKYISSHLSDDINLHSLAVMYAMSDSHFSRIFKQYTGLGISKYIKLTRLRKAEKLLVSGKYSITEIALKCGFNNSNYFISEFKKHKGITPFKYASLNKEN